MKKDRLPPKARATTHQFSAHPMAAFGRGCVKTPKPVKIPIKSPQKHEGEVLRIGNSL